MKIKNKTELEDFFHDVIALMLPNIDVSNIRPAFQKTKQANPVAKNYVSQDGSTSGLEGFTNLDDFVYFRVLADAQNSSHSEVTESGKTSFISIIELTVYLYGDNSQVSALLLKSLVRTQKMQEYLNSNSFYQLNEGEITPLSEEINEEWWDRNDLTMYFTYKVEIEPTIEDAPVQSIGYNNGENPNVIVDGGER